MPVKHITFEGVDRDAWIRSQRTWLERSIASGGLRSAWGAEARGSARAVFEWESDEALRAFMEHDHDRTLAEAGTVGRHAVLYLDPVEAVGDPTREGATWVGESVAWVKEGGDAIHLESQRTWLETMARTDGFVSGSIVRGRRTFVTTSFWRDGDAHARYVDDVVPGLRASTRGDEMVARLVRFDGPLVAALAHLTPA